MKKILIGVLVFLNFAVSADFKVRVANGFTLPSGLNLYNGGFYEFSIKENYDDFTFSVWHGNSDLLLDDSKNGFKETDYSISYKNFTLAYFDIPGDNDIIFTKYELPYGFQLKTLNPIGEKSGIQLTKGFNLYQNIDLISTIGTDPFTGDYFFTPNLKYKYTFKNVEIVTEFIVPFGEVEHTPHVIAGISYNF